MERIYVKITCFANKKHSHTSNEAQNKLDRGVAKEKNVMFNKGRNL